MDVERLNIYERLRDFKVPSTVLDSIFADEKDLNILEKAFNALIDDGYKEDDGEDVVLCYVQTNSMIFATLLLPSRFAVATR